MYAGCCAVLEDINELKNDAVKACLNDYASLSFLSSLRLNYSGSRYRLHILSLNNIIGPMLTEVCL